MERPPACDRRADDRGSRGSAEKSELLFMRFAQFTRTWKAGDREGGKPLPANAGDCSGDDKGVDEDCAVIRGWFSTIEHGIYEIDR